LNCKGLGGYTKNEKERKYIYILTGGGHIWAAVKSIGEADGRISGRDWTGGNDAI
jgi:hypothetical protein